MLSIRSQDRMSLVPYNKQITATKGGSINMVFDNGDTLPLGHYKTLERALEVLDEIEKANNDFYKAMNGAINAHELDYTYQMPKE